MQHKPLPTQEFLRSKYNYDPLTGILTTKRGKQVGGYSKKEKRLITSIKGIKFYVHRLIWMLHHGEDPRELFIDHINRNACDNSIDNLRAVTCKVNCLNSSRSDNAKHCTFHRGRWQAQVHIDNKGFYLGRFDTIEESKVAVSNFLSLKKLKNENE